MSLRAVRVAIVLRARESLVQGKGPQPVDVSNATYLNANTEVHPMDVREKQRRLSLMVVTDGSIRFHDLYGLLYNPESVVETDPKRLGHLISVSIDRNFTQQTIVPGHLRR
jgi:hypothetical protein